jgi:hypothetical protein
MGFGRSTGNRAQTTIARKNSAMRLPLLLCLLLFCDAAEAAAIKPPPAHAGFAISLSKTELNPTPGIGVYEVDLFDTAPMTIDKLHAASGYVICYFSAGSVEDWRPDFAEFPASLIGKDYEGWGGERWLDIRQRNALAPIFNARMNLAVEKKCDAVDPDNVDGFSNATGFAISANDQRAFNLWLAEAAHSRGLAIGLKNAAELVADLAESFDFAVIENCAAQDACTDYRRFADQGKAVFQIEYRGEIRDWEKACRAAKEHGFTAILASLELDGDAERCR